MNYMTIQPVSHNEVYIEKDNLAIKISAGRRNSISISVVDQEGTKKEMIATIKQGGTYSDGYNRTKEIESIMSDISEITFTGDKA